MTASTVMKTSTLMCLEAALEHFEQSGWTLRSVTAACNSKDLIKTPVWKYSGAFWKNSLCEQWWGTLAMTQRSLKACQLVSVQLKSALQNFYCCADTHSYTGWHEFPAPLQTSTPFLNIILDTWYEIFTINTESLHIITYIKFIWQKMLNWHNFVSYMM